MYLRSNLRRGKELRYPSRLLRSYISTPSLTFGTVATTLEIRDRTRTCCSKRTTQWNNPGRTRSEVSPFYMGLLAVCRVVKWLY
jgi:hypothetical protein